MSRILVRHLLEGNECGARFIVGLVRHVEAVNESLPRCDLRQESFVVELRRAAAIRIAEAGRDAMEQIVERAMQCERVNVAFLVETAVEERRAEVDHPIELALRADAALNAGGEMAVTRQEPGHHHLPLRVEGCGCLHRPGRHAPAQHSDAAVSPDSEVTEIRLGFAVLRRHEHGVADEELRRRGCQQQTPAPAGAQPPRPRYEPRYFFGPRNFSPSIWKIDDR